MSSEDNIIDRKAKRAAYHAAWRKANAEKFKASRDAWRAANAERYAAAQAAWRKANKEKRAAYDRAWRQANPERRAAVAAEYRKNHLREEAANRAAWNSENPDKVRAYKKAWSDANPEKRAISQSEYRKKRPDKFAEKNAKRRARVLNAIFPLSPEHCAEMAELYTKAQILTRQTGIAHHVDHIIPLQGKSVCGLHVPWNMQVIPGIENLLKGNLY